MLVAKQRELAVFNAQLDQAGSVVEQADATLELAKIQLNDTRVTAPFSGVIGKRGAMVGQYVQPGQALYSLFRMGQCGSRRTLKRPRSNICNQDSRCRSVSMRFPTKPL